MIEIVCLATFLFFVSSPSVYICVGPVGCSLYSFLVVIQCTCIVILLRVHARASFIIMCVLHVI